MSTKNNGLIIIIINLTPIDSLTLFQFLRSESWNSDRKTGPHSFEFYRPKNKDFPWFPCFRFEPYTQKRKPGNHRNSTKRP